MGRFRSGRKCKEIGDVAVMTRALAAESGRKRKVDECSGGKELSCSSRSLVQLSSSRRHRRLFVSTPPPPSPENSSEKAAASNDPYASSCCSSNGSIELENDASKFVDVEEEEEGSEEMATSTYGRRREMTPLSSEVRAESAEMESTVRPPSSQAANSCRRLTSEEMMPSEAELEEFFSKAEQNLHKQFAQKYNFDIVKEEPLEGGRYEWVRVKP